MADERPAARADPRWGLGDAVVGWLVSVVASTIVAGIVLGLMDQDEDDVSLVTTALLQIPLWLGLVGTVIWAGVHKGNGLRADFGFLAKPFDPLIGLAAGFGTQLLLIPVYLPLLELFDIDSDRVSEDAEQLTDKAHGAGVVLLVLIVVIGAPIVEELFYRGLLLRSLERRVGTPWSVVITAVVFALSHFQGIQIPALIIVGLVTGFLTVRTGRLGPAIFTHLTFNAITVSVLLA